MAHQIRIVVLDYYMSAPLSGLDVCYSEFRGGAVAQVPVLRCFGSNELGQKICIHIHGAFPYLYIPYDGSEDATKMSYQLAASIDKALNVSMNQGMSGTQHVYKIALVSGIPMYGYHFKKHQFFKISLYNPMLITKVCGLLLNKSIMGKVWQAHEAHLNFTLQFMIDYNLHGMSNMIVENLKFRVDSKIETACDNFLPYNIKKITTSEVEGDINAQDILNRQEIISGNLAANPGIAALWADEKQRRRNKNEISQLGQFIELKNINTPATRSHEIFKEALLRRLAILSDDKSNETISPLDSSVYPIETPDDRDIQNASIVDLHSPSSYELSLDDTVVNLSQILDITASQNLLNVSLEETDKEFLKMLQEMAEENAQLREEDSILSQTVVEDESNENNESSDDNLDMTMSLEEITNSLDKIHSSQNLKESQKIDDIIFDNEDIFNTTIIPQLDGQTDEFLEEIEDCNGCSANVDTIFEKNQNRIYDLEEFEKYEHLSMNFRQSRSLPQLDLDFLPNAEYNSKKNRSIVVKNIRVVLPKLSTDQIKLFNTVKRKRNRPKEAKSKKNNYFKIVKHIRKNENKKESKEEREMRSFSFQVKQKNRTDRLHKLSSFLRKKDRIIANMMDKKSLPKFRSVPATKYFLDRLLYLNCDGTFDPGSSEEEEFEIHCDPKKSRKRAPSARPERSDSEESHKDQNFHILGLKKSRLC